MSSLAARSVTGASRGRRPSPWRARRRSGRLVAIALAAALLVLACGADAVGPDGPTDAMATGTSAAPVTPTETVDPVPPPVDPASVGADELGAIPVLMYHRLLDEPTSEYDLTPAQFREELEWLFANGYRPVLAADMAEGRLDVPAGTTPVVLTFDDSTMSQVRLTEDGEIDPDSAIGILLEVAAAHDDVRPVASLYAITSSLFGGGTRGDRIVAALVERGFELGNHSHDHTNLGRVDGAEVQRQLALNVVTLAALGASVTTLSLPYGIQPSDRSLALAGEADGTAYRHGLVLLVGAGPAPSPFHADFDPGAVPRIRSSPAWPGGEPDYGSRFWLEWLAAEPGRRYVSDGDPTRISFPAARSGELAAAHAGIANPY
jgi:peptidoglycan/xylan/chitin deacetylase (PgdA/CDA1 family)